jgi:hypothetical protein
MQGPVYVSNKENGLQLSRLACGVLYINQATRMAGRRKGGRIAHREYPVGLMTSSGAGVKGARDSTQARRVRLQTHILCIRPYSL